MSSKLEQKCDFSNFHCTRCGNCCRVPGFVQLQADEIERLAKFLDLDIYLFTEQYTDLLPTRGQLTLKETAEGACIFLKPDNSCAVQEVKPRQCAAFPYHWRYDDLKNICPASQELPLLEEEK